METQFSQAEILRLAWSKQHKTVNTIFKKGRMSQCKSSTITQGHQHMSARHSCMRQNSIVIRCVLDGYGIESRCGKFFSTRLAWSSGSILLCNRYKVFSGVKWLGPSVDYSPSISTQIKEMVELYLSTFQCVPSCVSKGELDLYY